MTHPDYTNGPTYYPQGNFLGYVVYLDFGNLLVGPGVPDQTFSYRVFQIIAGCLAPAGITVTNRYPRKLRPGEYTRVAFDPETLIGFRESATGTSPQKQLTNPSWFTPFTCYASWYPNNADLTAYIAAHETAHGVTSLDFEPNHETELVDGGPNLMAASTAAGYGGKLSPRRVADIRETIARFKGGDRLGPFLPPQGGQWTFGWHRIGN